MTKKRVFIICLIIAIAMIASLAGCKKESPDILERADYEDKLTVYTAHKEEIYKPIIREFEERSGIRVEVISGGTNQMLEKIAEDNGNGAADIMFGGGVDSLVAYEGYFEPYVTSQAQNLDRTYASATDSYTVFSKLPTVFIYNTKLVIPAGAPRTWNQLLEYMWEDEIAFADPSKSGSAYTALSMLLQQTDRDGYDRNDAIEAFCKNLNGDLSEGSNTIVSDVASGDKMIGVVLEENALKGMDGSTDIEMMYPSDGTCAVPDGCAIIKGCRNRESAEKFMEFVVSDDVQHLLEDRLYRRSVRTDFDSSDVPMEVPYDIEFSNENREEILATFNKQMEVN